VHRTSDRGQRHPAALERADQAGGIGSAGEPRRAHGASRLRHGLSALRRAHAWQPGARMARVLTAPPWSNRTETGSRQIKRGDTRDPDPRPTSTAPVVPL
jgi:hypothetical protein